MAAKLVANNYGKAGIRLLHVDRTDPSHEIRDVAVDVSLAGEFTAAHTAGDNTNILPTDTQKNTVYAVALEHGVGEIEDFALRLARHFVHSHGPAAQATVSVAEHSWDRVGPHSFQGTVAGRSVNVRHTPNHTRLISAAAGLSLLNTTGSEFAGFATDQYTTLLPTKDRILATLVDARWQHTTLDVSWAESHGAVRRHLIEAFADTYSYSLQQTLYAMATRVLDHRPEVASIRLSMPNRHHVLVDLAPFGLVNDNEVYAVPDRPYGLIEATVARDGLDDIDWT